MPSPKLLLLLTLAAPALAVQPSHWVHTNEADFKPGQFEGVVATNLGDLKLSREIKTILEQDPRISAVYALAEAPDGTLYAGTGPQGMILRIVDSKVETVLELGDGTSVFALAIDRQGGLLIGASGQRGRLLRLNRGDAQPAELLAPPSAQYIWALAQAPDGTIYAATGPNGELHQLNPDGSSKVLLKTDERNFLSLAFDGQDTLFVGTDPNGLVYRVNRHSGELFVLYDAAESEVGALALDRMGNLYAGTSEAVEGPSPAAAGAGAAGGPSGRPEGEPAGMPIPAQPPREPQPPELPDPNPSEPDPIPTTGPDAAAPAPTGVRPALARSGDAAVTSSAPPESAGPAQPLVVAQPAERTHLAEPANTPLPDNAPDARPVQEAPGDPEAPDAEPLPGVPQAVAAGTQPPPAALPQPSTEPRPEGNAIYRIDAQGFVTELFRGPVMVLDMAEQDGRLIVGTGSEGLVYQIDPTAEETVVLADLEPQQVMTLLPTRDGRIALGLANTGGIAAMSRGFAPSGTYVSPVLDAAQVARFGKLHIEGALPQGTALLVSARSGNVQESTEKGWSAWSEPVGAQRFLDAAAPPARFLQYRFLLSTTNPDSSPIVSRISIAYQVPNLPPQIQSIAVAAANGGGDGDQAAAPTKHTVAWLAADPNGDALAYALHYRLGSTGPWILLKDKLTDPSFEWNTRSLADGRYYVRVTASDALANAAGQGRIARRVSDVLTIDNTPPLMGDLSHEQTPQGLRVNLRAVDRTGTVARVEYTLDSAGDWQAVLSSDTIFDSPAETVSFVIPDLKAGPHQVSIRATDAAGNRSYETLQVTVQPADAPAAVPAGE